MQLKEQYIEGPDEITPRINSKVRKKDAEKHVQHAHQLHDIRCVCAHAWWSSGGTHRHQSGGRLLRGGLGNWVTEAECRTLFTVFPTPPCLVLCVHLLLI